MTPLNDAAQLAQQVMPLLIPVLTFAATRAGEGFLSEPGAKLFDWLMGRLKGQPQAEAALQKAITQPHNPELHQELRSEIEGLANRDPEFRQQLAELIQTATVNGDNNKIAQAHGSNINIRIG